MKQSEVKTQSLKSYHTGVASVSVAGILIAFLFDNWGDWVSWLPLFIAVVFDGKKEKADELAKLNISKANTVSMWLLFAAFAVFGMFARNHTIPAAPIVAVICAVLAIRSILFLIFDRAPAGEEDADG
ncbi:MAG: hypothetical protein IKX57_04525 [Oscillospiraceae bacterium]|nr:hypothetical protein [Oscillospiraceae bacterium]